MIYEKLLLLMFALTFVPFLAAKAYATPIPLISGPQDISTTNSTLNMVIQELNGLFGGGGNAVNIFTADPPAPLGGQCMLYFVRSGPTSVNLSTRCGPSGAPLVLQTNIGTQN